MLMDKKAELRGYTKLENGVFRWVRKKDVWVSKKDGKSSAFFSKLGMAARSREFILRKTEGIHPFEALFLEGKYYFITSVEEEGLIYKVTTAEIQPVICKVEEMVKIGLTDKKEPIREKRAKLDFEAILTEKYAGFKQETPVTRTTVVYVLIVPKLTPLEVSNIVTIGEEKLTVRVPHLLDEYKNEYEIWNEVDV